MKREQAQQMLTEFTQELKQLLKRYPQVAIDRADGLEATIIVIDEGGGTPFDYDRGEDINVRERVYCSELYRAHNECTEQ